MGRIAKVLSFTRQLVEGVRFSEVKINPGGGANITAKHFAPAGDDSFPLATDYAITVKIPRSGGEVIVGYADPISAPKALSGDKRIYARDSSGALAVELWLRSDGSLIIDNGAGTIELLASGTINLNGVTIDTSGNIVSPAKIEATTSLIVDGIEMLTHSHPQANDSGGNIEQNVGAPI